MALANYAWQKFSLDFSRTCPTASYDGREVEALLKRSIESVADTVDQLRVRLGDFYYRTARYAEAEQNYRQALIIRGEHASELIPSQDDLLLRLSRSSYRMGQPEQALTYAAQAALENSENEQAKNFFFYLRSLANP
jgi:tetratricopeptide (TPR) repeat protein